ncbi:Dynamin-like 120 kDa isoform 1 [Chlorella sorokiniana]|uniref:Dynamin-like 120 kDa isoform 1 n=1 Tax=Chlorella sorokiniana TaxID=3076 RepID=A0A2P6TQL7_CHLSO|nr:Dynamin-like 120 kDa isoform 1 [Chlorella sorokiniana]|eukprot:PRW56292.1 Dynamin-like 120 kDa isoform 1 [Chlorella sorokiniana]
MPVELRVGSTGAGLFVGCGAGIGIVTPLSLHAVPVLGQLAASLSTSLSTLNSATGGVTSAARRHVRALGVPGLDIGFGCGIMLGYGWGAGLMLKPSALSSLTATLQSAGRAVTERLPQPVQAALAQRQAQQHASGGWGGSPAGLGGAAASSTGVGLQDLQQQRGLAADQAHSLSPSRESSGSAASPEGTQQSQQQQRQQHEQQQQQEKQQELASTRQELAELARLVLKQQNQLGDLQEQLGGLQAAVCKLDAAAPGCKRTR